MKPANWSVSSNSGSGSSSLRSAIAALLHRNAQSPIAVARLLYPLTDPDRPTRAILDLDKAAGTGLQIRRSVSAPAEAGRRLSAGPPAAHADRCAAARSRRLPGRRAAL